MLARMLTAVDPKVEWKDQQIIELAGRKWGCLEMIYSRTTIHSIMIFTGYKGQMLLFNFNSTQDEFPKWEKALRESLQWISIRE